MGYLALRAGGTHLVGLTVIDLQLNRTALIDQIHLWRDPRLVPIRVVAQPYQQLLPVDHLDPGRRQRLGLPAVRRLAAVVAEHPLILDPRLPAGLPPFIIEL